MLWSVAVLLVSAILTTSCAPVSRRHLHRHHPLRCTHAGSLTKLHLPQAAKVILPRPKHQVLLNPEGYNENDVTLKPFLTSSLLEPTSFYNTDWLLHSQLEIPSWSLLRNPAVAFAPTAPRFGDNEDGNQRSFPEIDAKGFNENIFHEEFGTWYPMRW